MKKKILALAAAAALCLGMASCGGDKADKDYELKDETGIININPIEGFEKRSEYVSDDRTEMTLAKDNEEGTMNEIIVMVRYAKVEDDTLENAADQLASYSDAKDLKRTEEEFQTGTKAQKVVYIDDYSSDKSLSINYVMVYEPEGNKDGKGYIASIRCTVDQEEEKAVEKQLDEIFFNWDADYDFGA